ncbi:hypothetical protein Asppvi_001858 [Aspergillus pseudoviridinutans]|uniref:HNH nuclease domain-containing protein n=1 Tax=Aspergillus pseudoviridinutans TaxID=1517512 RepID=A0A9P3BNI8_9EURO|nr:uncharacterized protein Asppvi_001858 [Aspergillus pseudoviridinutans]GIJ92580.1 hypothetical protein Asppvi_001858 [Aspergillus pseudoviridinutans]
MASSSGPGAPFEETERIKLVHKITDAVTTLPFFKADAIKSFKTFYACLWLADMEKLQYLIDRHLPDGPHWPIEIYDKFCRVGAEGKIGQNWQQKDRQEEAVDSRKGSWEYMDSPNGKRPKRQSAEVACCDRDKACILTNCSKDICQPYPLYPYWMNDENMDDVQHFFAALREFWSDKKVHEWYNAIYGDGFGPEKPENLILLSPNAYALYAKGYIVLEPVNRDAEGKWLTLKLWWLQQHEGDCVYFSIIPQLPSDIHPSDYGAALHDIRNDRPLLSGETITLETHDPENYPLPDTRILEMQWVLNRVLALSGTVKPNDLEDDEWHEDSDEELI